MTELLRDTMSERAGQLDRPRTNLDDVMAAGERRQRRRGAVGVAGAAAVCAVIVVAAVQGTGSSDDAEDPGYANVGDFSDRKVAYAIGSTIHYGDDQLDVGVDVDTFVQTDAGFVFTDTDGTAYRADGTSVRQIQHGVGELRADESGTYVAWIDERADPHEFVAYDSESMTELARVPSRGRPSGMQVIAVDGRDLYVVDRHALHRVDMVSGRSERLRGGIAEPYVFTDVEDGRILRQINASYDRDDGIPPGTVMSRDPRADEPLVAADARDLSPGARYVSTDFDDSERIFATRSGAEVELDTAGYDFQALIRWLDADTSMIMTLNKPYSDPEVSLLTCEVPSGRCETRADGLDSDLRLPVGEPVFAH